MQRKIDLIAIHTSDSPNGKWVTINDIDEWHQQRGFKRSPQWRDRQNPSLKAVGYHFVIGTNGAIWSGRHLEEVGAHIHGYNSHSVGICMVGNDKWSPAQWESLRNCVTALGAQLLGIQRPTPESVRDTTKKRGLFILGHRDLSPDKDGDGTVERVEWLKTCPNFDVTAWLASGMEPDAAHVLNA